MEAQPCRTDGSISPRLFRDFDSFYWDIKEKVHSLLMFDVVEIDAGISEELRKEIKKDGVVIYEKA